MIQRVPKKRLALICSDDYQITNAAIDRTALKKLLIDFIEQKGIIDILSGLEPELGLLDAEIVLELKHLFPIRLECVIPYEEYTTHWSEPLRNRFFRVMGLCDTETLLQTHFSMDSFQKRAAYLQKEADYLLYLERLTVPASV